MTDQPQTPPRTPAGAILRAITAVMLDLAGFAALITGFWWLAPWAGLVVLGLGLIIVAWAIDPPVSRGGQITIVEEEPEPRPNLQAAGGLHWSSEQ